MLADLNASDWGVLFLSVLVAAYLAGTYLAAVYFKPRDRGRLARLEAKLDLLLKNAGVEYDPFAQVPQQVRSAVLQGRKIEAIKLYRQATGAGLAEAKAVIEELQARQS
jgi:hypothetical protein